MIKPKIKESKSFESTVDELIHEKVRQDLLKSRKHPEVIYLKDKAAVSQVESILIALHGLRGQRTPVLVDPDLHIPYEIKWGL